MEKSLAELVQSEMLRLGWSFGEMARRAGTSKANIQNVAKGASKGPRAPLIKAVARALASAPDSAYSEEEWGERLTLAAGYPHAAGVQSVIRASSDPERMRDLFDRLPPEIRAAAEGGDQDALQVAAKVLAAIREQQTARTKTASAQRPASPDRRR